MNLSGLWLNICGRVHGAEAAAADDSGRCPGCRIGGVLRGDSLFSADGAAGIVWGWWLTGWLIGGASPRCVCAWGCLLLESCVRRWCALLVGKLLLPQLAPTLGWLVEDHVWWLLVVGWPARGLYALGGRSRSGKAADSFRQIDDFFAI